MIIKGLALQDIRSHSSFALQFQTSVVLVIGPNASGKTTLVEAVGLLATGDSFRAGKIHEIIAHGKELGRVKGKIVVNATEAGAEDHRVDQSATDQDEIEVILTRGEVQGKRTAARLFSVNGVRRRKKDATGKFYAGIFRPEDMRLVEGSPSRRRAFLNSLLQSLSAEYAASLRTYDQALVRRNKLLLQVREGEQPATILHYWNLTLIKHAAVIQRWRREFLQACGAVAFELPFAVEYQSSALTEEKVKQYQTREIAAGHTLVGPHKDDFTLTLPLPDEQLPLASYGSRGQQRLGVLWLKYCELAFADRFHHGQLVVVLDDILSELDPDSRSLVLQLARKYQTIVTTTEQAALQQLKQQFPGAQVVELPGSLSNNEK
jgi:DNA replication and repair protein RecF